MLLYISSNENKNIFDFLDDGNGMVIKKLTGYFSLKQFIINDMRNLNHYTYISIDITALKDNEEELIEAVVAFKKMFSTRIIFYVEDIKKNENLIKKVIDQGIYNIVSADTVDQLNKEIQKAISDIGIRKKEIELKLQNLYEDNTVYVPEYVFKNKNISVAIIGTATKVGTTTMAINICNYLSDLGATVCYIEANRNNHIKDLPGYYNGIEENENSIIFNGVRYFSLQSRNGDDYNFIIYDMGIVNSKMINTLKNKCNIIILCATAKPYEIVAYDEAINLLGNINIHSIFSFVQDESKLRIVNKYKKVLFSEYTPNFFESEKNKDIWEQIFGKYIIKKTIKKQ